MPADFHYAHDAPFGLIRIGGELDLATSSQLCNLLHGLAKRECTHLTLDLGGVTFIDAYTLRILDQEQRRLRLDGGDLSIVAASGRCRSIIELSGYDGLRPTHRSGAGLNLVPRLQD